MNLSVTVEVLETAREARVNLSALLERALIEELARLRRQRWREDNVRAVGSYNEHVASHRTCFEGQLDE